LLRLKEEEKKKKHYLTCLIGGSLMAEYTVWVLDSDLKRRKMINSFYEKKWTH